MRIDLNTKIAAYFGSKKYLGLKYGLELEYENAKVTHLDIDTTPLTRWKVTKDYSLRNNGVEFVSRPTTMDQMETAVDQMLKAAASINARATSRCGLHVHVNMTDRTFLDLYNLSVLYTLLEPVLFAEYCQGRSESHFCVPTYTNTVLVENMFDDMQKLRRGFTVSPPVTKKIKGTVKVGPSPKPTKKKLKTPFGNMYVTAAKYQPLPLDILEEVEEVPPPTDYLVVSTPDGPKKITPDKWVPIYTHPTPLKFHNVAKYAALNYSALKKFGTIEYRQHPSTLNKEELIRWVRLLDQIHQYAYTFTDPLDIIQLYDEDGLFTLCEKVGLQQTKEVDPIDLEDAVDAATMMAGHQPVDWRQLDWEAVV